MGKDILFGYNESSKLTAMTTELSKRFGPPSSFLTFSFNDIGNPRSIRSTFRTINNKRFPAMFDTTSGYGSNGKEFIDIIMNASTNISEGTIQVENLN